MRKLHDFSYSNLWFALACQQILHTDMNKLAPAGNDRLVSEERLQMVALGWIHALCLPSITNDEAKEFRARLENSKMIPLHILTDATEIEKYLERYGNLRALELKEEVGDYFSVAFDDLEESGKNVLGRLFNVDNEGVFNQLKVQGKVVWDQLIQERLVAWKNSLKNCSH